MAASEIQPPGHSPGSHCLGRHNASTPHQRHLAPPGRDQRPLNRITSAAYRRFSLASPASGGSAVEPLNGVYCSATCPCACQPWRGPHDADPPQPTISNCGPTADRRGAHQNVLAYTFFGTNITAYLDGIKDNAMQALGLYPGWIVRIYHDGNANFTAWDQAACDVSCR